MSAPAATPLLQLQGVVREYPAGDGVVAVLRDVELTIERGEMVAIMGPSGSGKSTLMNIIGCLDQATRGSYRVDGRETRELPPDELARLRREHFGFVFQRYQLINSLSAQSNVEIPAVYADLPPAQRSARSLALLERLGLGERTTHRPNQLSGGQQQRVSIARALMNGGHILLADEPTGALDSASGEEVMRILRELNDAGHTIILVTHDADVAAHARRVIRLRDGLIVHDDGPDTVGIASGKALDIEPEQGRLSLRMRWSRTVEAARMALRAMMGNRLRTLLTMLGIIIGIASVVVIVALGAGSKEKVLKDMNAAGSHASIEIMPGSGFGDRRAASIRTLVVDDARALAALPGVVATSPVAQTAATLRVANLDKSASVFGVSENFRVIRGLSLVDGRWFDAGNVRQSDQVAVIDANTRKALFPRANNVVGESMMVGAVPVRVIGVTGKSNSPFGEDKSLNVWLPYTTLATRITGNSGSLSNITVSVAPSAQAKDVERDVQHLLTVRHGRKDFFTNNSDKMREMIEKTIGTLTLLISSIALISLVVGGIGVMNIMLVSVTERTQEIGVRMAVGARQGDILRQFLIEAIAVCMVGGLLGIALAFGIGGLFSLFVKQFSMIFSPLAFVVAVACSTLIGATFGFLPARNAARLNPVDALAHQ